MAAVVTTGEGAFSTSVIIFFCTTLCLQCSVKGLQAMPAGDPGEQFVTVFQTNSVNT